MRAEAIVMASLALLGSACGSSSQQVEHADDYVLEGSGPELYEQVLVPVLFAPWAEDLILRAGLVQGERVLDVATGTGIVARKAAVVVGPEGEVDALDISAAMLDVARSRSAPALPPIRWTEGDALNLPYADGSFDVVFCQQALQFFPDRRQALSEMRRVLLPGGRVVVSAWRSPAHNPYGLGFARAVAQHMGVSAGEEVTSPFGWDDPDELRALMQEVGLSEIDVSSVILPMNETDLRQFVLNDLLAYPSTGTVFAAWSDADKESLIQAILASLEEHRSDSGWSIPWASNVARASR